VHHVENRSDLDITVWPEKEERRRKTTPRRKRLKRAQRLESAKAWLATYAGQKIARDYRRRYGVDWQTAFTELEMLGIPIDPDYKTRVLHSIAGELAARRRKKAERETQLRAELGFDQNEYFAYIVGYTSGGAPYGLTWDEWAAIEAEEPGWLFDADQSDGEDPAS